MADPASRLIAKKSIALSPGLGQAIALADRMFFVPAAIYPPVLQDRNDLFNKQLYVIRSPRRLDGVTIHRAISPEVNKAIRDLFRRPQKQPVMTFRASHELPGRKL